MINTNPNTPSPQTPVQQSDNPDLYMGLAAGQAGGTTASSATDVGAPIGGTVPAALLTPEALMAYCQNRLGSIDSQIQTIFAQQQQSSSLIQTIDDAAAAVSKASDNGVINSKPQLETLDNTIMGAISAAGGLNTTTGQELYKTLQTLDPGCSVVQSDPSDPTSLALVNPGSSASPTLVAATVKNLQNAAQDVNSDAELNMIQLQSLMSDRQTAIQISTNMIQSMGQTDNEIAANVGKS